eukprot:6477300-Amphidinium_carterae.1
MEVLSWLPLKPNSLCVDFWTSDNIPEDWHTAYKAYLLNTSISVISIKPFICNDTVVRLKDRSAHREQ